LKLIREFYNTRILTRATDKDGTTSLDYAFKGGHLTIAEFLVEKGAVINSSSMSMTALQPPCSPELTHAADQFGKTSLHYASEGGHLSAVKYLVDEKKMDVDVRGMSKMELSNPACAQAHSDYRYKWKNQPPLRFWKRSPPHREVPGWQSRRH
jgi:ankyrin repeat protein